MDPVSVAKKFQEEYYTVFDHDPVNLAQYYEQFESTLTVNGITVQGVEAIYNNLRSSDFQPCTHRVISVDCVPLDPNDRNGILLVMVMGTIDLPVRGTKAFSQMFHVRPTPEGRFFVLNDIFRAPM